jgi:hypothetical protein
MGLESRLVSRKLALPIAKPSVGPSMPTIDGMRERLGGRLVGKPSSAIVPGSVVAIAKHDDAAQIGVLLADDSGAVDVYLSRGLVKRTTASAIRSFHGEIAPDLSRVAEQARVFAALSEGQLVHVEQGPGESVEATLLEKCRYGALVAAPSGKVLGVGFRRLWPRSSDPRPS